MREIAATPWNGLRVVSTFSGCGGSCLGFRLHGYRVVYANEFVEAARETYAANYPETPLDGRDIRAVTGASIRAMMALEDRDQEIDVLEGSPPCAAFSTAGKREATWGQVRSYSDTAQRTDDLFAQYVRILKELQPRAFVLENVSGLVKGVAKGIFKEVYAALRDAGYTVGSKLLDAQWLGVPQARQRIIFVGLRADLQRTPPFPKPLGYRYSIRDALPELTGEVRGRTAPQFGERTEPLDEPIGAVWASGAERDQYEIAGVATGRGRALASLDEPVGTILTHGRLKTFSERGLELRRVTAPANDGPALADYAIAAEYDKLKQGETSSRYFNLVRPSADAPVPTVTALGGSNPGVASVTHPTERRKFTIAELRRLCGFPDDFVLTGTYAQQWERLGRAVPPPMMAAVAGALLPVLKESR
jgi:DNA (cytosine-5)-methyltransferase 1